MSEYLADFNADFHDIRRPEPRFARYSSTKTHAGAQKLGRVLLQAHSNGFLYRSVRVASGICLACFRPRLVNNVRIGAHFEYRWTGGRTPQVVTLMLEGPLARTTRRLPTCIAGSAFLQSEHAAHLVTGAISEYRNPGSPHPRLASS